MLSLENLTASADKKKILHGISYDFEPGKIYAVWGPNGSGKSTLAHVLMASPLYAMGRGSRILWQGKNIVRLSPDQRARLGFFLSFQSPHALEGVSVFQLLRLAGGKQGRAALEVRRAIESYAKALKIPAELLSRPLNVGFSGGEKKKLEVLQAAVLKPSVLILDEVDTGVDVDALRTIATFLKKHRRPDQIVIVITHSTKLLETLQPDRTLVLKDGELVRTGPGSLAVKIEKQGFKNISK